MSRVRVTYVIEPDDPDDEHETGLSEAEFERRTDELISQGADEIEFEKVVE